MVKPYCIILTADNLPDLNDKINDHCEYGYRLFEGIVTYNVYVSGRQPGIVGSVTSVTQRFAQVMLLEGLSIPQEKPLWDSSMWPSVEVTNDN